MGSGRMFKVLKSLSGLILGPLKRPSPKLIRQKEKKGSYTFFLNNININIYLLEKLKIILYF